MRQAIQFFPFLGVSKMSDPVRYVAVDFSQTASWQVEWTNEKGDSGVTQYAPCPSMQDLSGSGIPAGATCLVHDQVGDQHKHSEPFVYSPTGGLLTLHIKDSEGHYDNWTYYPPA